MGIGFDKAKNWMGMKLKEKSNLINYFKKYKTKKVTK
jgi:hypothetical protein